MLIDAVIINDELDMLEFRLRMLWPIVDKFIIVEATRTFSGNEKPLFLFENKERFNWASEKIVPFCVSVDSPGAYILPKKYDPDHVCWKVESQQRNGIGTILDFLSMPASIGGETPHDAVVMVGDVDEIPTREAIEYALDNKVWEEHPVVFRQSMFYYNLKFMRKETWHGTIITGLSKLLAMTPQKLRDCRNGLPNAIENGGWHLSHFGGIDKIRHKIESYSHQENNKESFKNPLHVAHCIDTGEDLYDRDVPIMPVKREQFPDYFREFAPEGWW